MAPILGTEREGPPAGANLEEGTQICGTGYPPNALADRPWGSPRGRDAVSQRLGDLAPPPQGILGGREGLHRRLGALTVPAEAQGVARAVEAPVLRVEVGVGKLLRRSGDDSEAGGGRMLLQPVLHGLEIGRLELPLDLLVVQYLILHGVDRHLS